MSHGHGIRKNTFYAVATRVIRLVTNMLLFVGIARFYGVEGFGQFTTAHTLSTIFLLLADFGFDSLLPTQIASGGNGSGKAIEQYFALKLVFLVLATLGMLFLPLFHSFSDETRLLVQIFALYIPFASLGNFFYAVFKGYERFNHETRIAFVTNAATLLVVLIFGWMHAPLAVLAGAFVGTRAFGTLLALITARQLSNVRLLPLQFGGWRDVWSKVVIFGLHFLFSNLYFQLDTILLAFWRGDRDVGIYQSAFKIVALGLIVPDIALNAMMPVLSRLFATDRKRYEEYGRLLAKLLMVIGMPVSVALLVSADQIIAFVYGAEEFTESALILRCFAVTTLVRYAVEPYGLLLTTSERQKTRMIIVGAATVVSLGLNWFLIPVYGPLGAALVSLLANILVGLSILRASGVSFVSWSMDTGARLSVLYAVLFGVSVWSMRQFPVWITVPLLFGGYCLATYRTAFTREQVSLLRKGRDDTGSVLSGPGG